MHVVGRHQLYPRLLGKANQHRIDVFLFFQSVILNFEVKIIPEDIAHGKRKLFRALVIVAEQSLCHPARKAGGKAHEPLAVFF